MKTPPTDLVIGPPLPAEKPGWRVLYNGYAEFYKVPMTDEIADTVWGWIHDPKHEVEALVAKTAEGRLVGLAHFRAMARPLAGRVGGFLDDLFVAKDMRGSGVAEALMARMTEIGKSRNWQVIRWITAENNYRGRSFYDRIATKTHWLTYEIRP
ncbi:MAG: GNAT family N-acetyltransferase [Alphaproteobacteria bacterium]|nr:GNAT family N-acetyltransferase [Alphaproteobacteria bacterium]